MADEEATVGLITQANATQRSQYGLSRKEIIRNLTSRIVHSKAYLGVYLGMALLAFSSFILSVISPCPTRTAIILEVVINAALLLDVVLRLFTLGKRYWKSAANVADAFLVLLCIVTLVVVASGQCDDGSSGEEIMDEVLLVVRNAVQFMRAWSVLRRNKRRLEVPDTTIDFSGLQDSSSVDDDLESNPDVLSPGHQSAIAPPSPHSTVIDIPSAAVAAAPGVWGVPRTVVAGTYDSFIDDPVDAARKYQRETANLF